MKPYDEGPYSTGLGYKRYLLVDDYYFVIPFSYNEKGKPDEWYLGHISKGKEKKHVAVKIQSKFEDFEEFNSLGSWYQKEGLEKKFRFRYKNLNKILEFLQKKLPELLREE